ncbi:MAG TPA: AraC family transcriptional regulator [Puia sp.]|nr:AraC family transcriptional regulator [Puia sp.]
MHIPQHRGSGLIKNIFLEEGLYLRYTRLRYYEDIEIIRLSKAPDSEIIFALCFLLTPTSLKLIKPIFKSHPQTGYPSNVFLTSNNGRLSTQIPEGVLSHTIELLFSREWLYTHLAGMEEKILSISGALEEGGTASVIAETTQPADDHLLSEIEFELHKPLFNLLTVRSRALMVMANIINRIPGDNAPRLPAREAPYIQTLRQVEQRLVECLEDMLPSQKQLAKEFAISESTLKRHFKAIYGKTIYEYYLQKKMELAKWLLQEKKISVSETAYMLGYEKVSAFITIFKKYHNVLPGSLK